MEQESFSVPQAPSSREAIVPETAASDIERVLQGFSDYVTAQRELRDFVSEDSPEDSHRKQDLLRRTTTYHTRLMELVLAHSNDREALATLWLALSHEARKSGDRYLATSIRRGILSQVATYRAFERLGRAPALATPDDDAFRAVDLWEDARTAVQVKWSGENEPQLLDTGALPVPAVAIDGANGDRYVASKVFHDAVRFRRKLEYFARKGKPVRGHLLVIPDSMIDAVTGEPTDAIIEFVRSRLPDAEQRAV